MPSREILLSYASNCTNSISILLLNLILRPIIHHLFIHHIIFLFSPDKFRHFPDFYGIVYVWSEKVGVYYFLHDYI